MRKLDSTTYIYPWFGVYYDDKETKICIKMDFDKGWCDILKDKGNCIKEKVEKDASQKYDCKCTTKLLCITMETTSLESENDVEKQKEIIKEFFQYSLNIVKDYI